MAEPQVELRGGADVRNPPSVAGDLDRRLDAADPQVTGRPRQRTAKELVPEARRRASREPPERRARERGAFCDSPEVHPPTLGNGARSLRWRRVTRGGRSA